MRVQVPARAMPGVCTLRKPTPWFSRRIAAVPFKANMRSPKRPRESVNSAAQAARDEDYLEIAKGFIPALSSDKHKGQNGKIGVIGGCTEYTGAPFYAAMGALRCGADLAHVFCTRGAGTVIKTYSPELIVHPYLYEEGDVDVETDNRADLKKLAISKTSKWLEKLSCVVVGPGLGRDPLVLETATELMRLASHSGVPVVVDADGLWIWQQEVFDKSWLCYLYPVVLTPNAVEMQRLLKRYGITNLGDRPHLAQGLLNEFLGDVTIVEKGRQDLIHGYSHTKVNHVARVSESRMCSISASNESGLKRCGGQGDILSGCIATFFSWGNAVHPLGNSLLWLDETTEEALSWSSIACHAACYLTREASRRAFGKHGRSMVCTDIIGEIGPAFSDVFSDHH